MKKSLVPKLARNQTSVPKTKNRGLRVFIMDLLSVVAYYDAYLCRAIQSQGMSVTLGAITYHLDRHCFSRLGIRNEPGLFDLVGRFRLPNLWRRSLKVIEMCLNLLALVVRFTFNRPDVVHVQYLPLWERQIPVELWFLKYCRFLGSSLVMTVHDIAPHDRDAAQFKRAFEMVDALICHSEAARQQILARFAIAAERVCVIPHGPLFFEHPEDIERATARRLCRAEDDECVVLCQGMIRPYKGIEFLIDAWAELQRSGARAKLFVVGKGEQHLLDSISQKVQMMGLEKSVQLRFQFVPTETMISYYRAADIVVYPYKAITTSGALMTGISQRKAIVATSLPPFQEMLENGKNALLCDYGDTLGLASALRSLIENRTLRNKLANATTALGRGEEAWREIAARTKDCYASIGGRAERSRAHDPVTAQ